MAGVNLPIEYKLVLLILLIGGSIVMGYGARRLGFPDHWSRRLMLFLLLGPYTLVGFLALWGLELAGQHALLPLIGFVLMAVGAFVGIMLARALGLNRGESGAFAMACGASNLGFTMGGTVNFVLFGETGLALASIFTSFWTFGLVLILYPIARYYGTSDRQPIWRLLWANFYDVRSLPLLGVLAGIACNLLGLQRPEAVERYHLMTLLIIGGVFIAFFTTGLRLYFTRMRHKAALYGIVAAVKFLLLPAAAALILIILDIAGLGLAEPGNRVVLVQASTAVGIYAVIIANLFYLDDKMATRLFFTNTVLYLLIILPAVVLLLA